MKIKKQLALSLLGFLCQTGAIAENNLEADFARPPDACKPWVFFFFENEVMDRPNITAHFVIADSCVGHIAGKIEKLAALMGIPVRKVC
jgi:hypothetical protein